MDYKEILKQPQYDFLRNDEHLGSNIMLLALGGSHAYGTANENSDLDVRGVAINTFDEMLLGKDFDQVIDNTTDTTIYSFNKAIKLLAECNPNMIEILGFKPEEYIHLTLYGFELWRNRKLFLSQRCVQSFGGYANAQLRRLENKSARLVSRSEQETHILKSIENAKYEFRTKFRLNEDDDVDLFIDKAIHEGYETEIFMNANLNKYPLRDWCGMWNEMKTIVSSYNKMGKRNTQAIARDKLGKHMCHLIRLYIMALDILEKEEIITKRVDEHDLLMDIRNGKYLDDNRQPIPEFFEMLNEYEKRFDYAKKNTSLPPDINWKEINEFKMSMNKRIVKRAFFEEYKGRD